MNEKGRKRGRKGKRKGREREEEGGSQRGRAREREGRREEENEGEREGEKGRKREIPKYFQCGGEAMGNLSSGSLPAAITDSESNVGSGTHLRAVFMHPLLVARRRETQFKDGGCRESIPAVCLTASGGLLLTKEASHGHFYSP